MQKTGHQKFAVDAKAPQKQCKYPDGHVPHHYEGRGGLIWFCQGRGVRPL